MSNIELAESAEDVLRLLDSCTEMARDENSADGYFSLIYTWETRDILAAADAGRFTAPDEVRRAIVLFGNRYFTARADFRARRPTSKCWTLAFGTARASSALVLQHILLGMNAHINYDLAAAIAETALPPCDYASVGEVLCGGVDRVQGCLNRTTPVLAALDVIGGNFDELLASYSVRAARHYAFDLVQRLRAAPAASRPALMQQADDFAFRLGQRLISPPLRDRLVLALVRLTERNVSPRELLGMLERV